MDFEHACASHRSSLGEFALPGAEKHYPPDLSIEPVHLDIALALDLVSRSCAGTVTLTVEARRAGAAPLVLHAVACAHPPVGDAGGRGIRWSYDGREIAVHWEEPFERGERRRLAVAYRVVRPASGLFFSAPTEAYPEEPWFAATDHETERARFWLPTVDLPSVRPALDFHLTAESRFTILANGSLLSEERHAGGTKTAHWRLESPCPSYLTCFAVGEFVRADDGEFEGIPIVYFAPPPFTPADLLRSFGRTREMLAWMTKKLDHPFPYPKYFQFALPGFGGAMENISLVSWDDCFVLDETLRTEWGPRVDLINLHEMAHSYFGDLVVCRDFAHAWLKESWATYMEECWLEDAKGEEERRYHSYRHAKAYFQEADEKYKRPIVTREFSSSWDLYDRHLYPGGACRLHTLRNELGDDVFWPAVAEYVRAYAGKTVETDDFRRILEARSGRSLGRFFDQWFHTAGYPFLKISFEHDAKKKEGTFKIEQAQVDEKAGVPAFHLTIELAWTAEGKTETLEVALENARQTVVVPMEKDPDAVRVDPRGKTLHKLEFNPGDERLRRQLREAPDCAGRIHAGQELAKSGKAKNIEVVKEATLAEPFWGVKVELAEALGKAGVQPAVDALAELAGKESDPRVLASLFAAAGRYRDSGVRTALEGRLAGELPYIARQAALEALGAQREDAPLAALARAAETDGFGGIVQSGAFRALAATRRAEAVEILRARIAHGACSNRARPAAVHGFAAIGRSADRPTRERVAERLAELLRDPCEQVRTAAVGALETIGEARALAALEAYRGALPLQEQVRVDRALSAIRRGQETRTAAIEKELEELRERMRKMAESIDRLEAKIESPGPTLGGSGSRPFDEAI